jgi:CubicO group peptidase (beta-lactamase class C family)
MFKPGTRFSYSNSGTYLLGLVIEKVTGQDYETYVKTKFFGPFGMTNSSVYDWRKIVKGRAKGYKFGKDGFQNAQRYDPLVPFSAGVILSTPGDLLKYRHAVFSSKLVSDKVRAQITTRETLADGTAFPYALGCLLVFDFEGHKKIGHAGDIFGFAAQYAYYPDDDVTIILTTNHDGAAFPPSTIERKIARHVLGIAAPAIKDLPLDDAARKVAGDYQVGAMRFGVDVLGFVVKDGKLNLSFGGAKSGAPLLPLRYQGDNKFVSTRDDENTFVFKPAAGGATTLEMTFYEGAFTATKAP